MKYNVVDEFKEAFIESVVHADGVWRRVGRWATIGFLTLASIGWVALGVVAAASGASVFAVVSFFIYALTFLIWVFTFTLTFNTSDMYRNRTQRTGA